MPTGADIARALGGTWDGRTGKARCPAHKDRTPSLSISEGDDGVPLVHCHAGCEQGDVIDALTLFGIDLRRGGPSTDASTLSTYRHKTLGKPSRTWPYHDARGLVVGAVARWDTADGKDIRPLIATDGRWRAGGLPEPRPLFRLPDILGNADAPILICEGEKAAEAAATLFPHVVATTPAHGAKSPHKTDWTPIAGREVLIWPDNDAPGAAFAAAVGRLAGQAGAAPVRVVPLPETLPDKWDLADEAPDGIDLAALLVAAQVPDPKASANENVDSESDDQAIARLAAMSQIEYERARKQAANDLGFGRVAMLDKMVAAQRPDNGNLQGTAVAWAEPDPWPDPVNGAALLVELEALMRRYVHLPDGGAEAAALWALYTWAFNCFSVAPNLMVTAPEREAGKSRVTEMLSWMVPRPKPVSDASIAAIIRGIERYQPTLLFDEAQHFLNRRAEDPIRGILLASFSRRFAQVERCEGDANEVRTFSTFTPKAMNGKNVANTDDMLTSRSIVIPMIRAPSRMPELREDRDPVGDELRRKCARWRNDLESDLISAEPDMGERYGRSADVWRPLFAVADAAGGDWPAMARRSAAALDAATAAIADNETLGTMLLADIRDVFAEAGDPDRIRAKEMDEKLRAIPERPWSALGRSGKPMTASKRGQLLKPYGIVRQSVWIERQSVSGYTRGSFMRAWNANLPAATANQPSRCEESKDTAGYSHPQGYRSNPKPNTLDSPKPAETGDSSHLEGWNAGNGQLARKIHEKVTAAP